MRSTIYIFEINVIIKSLFTDKRPIYDDDGDDDDDDNYLIQKHRKTW